MISEVKNELKAKDDEYVKAPSQRQDLELTTEPLNSPSGPADLGGEERAEGEGRRVREGALSAAGP